MVFFSYDLCSACSLFLSYSFKVICMENIEIIIAKLKLGDSDAFNTLVDLYQDRIFHYLFYSIQDRHEAEDLLQETFLRVLRSIHCYTHKDNFTGWIYQIAANLVRDYVRKQKRKNIVYSDKIQGSEVVHTFF